MTQPHMTQPHTTPPRPRPPAVRLDIRRVTLDGYSPGRRDHFARAIQAQLVYRGTPRAAARKAAEAILDSVDARMGHAPGGRRHG
jgi:hypothetical protein